VLATAKSASFQTTGFAKIMCYLNAICRLRVGRSLDLPVQLR
jgi:hypothetical protein